jgi:hypothetical protein
MSGNSSLAAQNFSHSIKIRAAQIKPTLRTTQFAAALLQFRRTIGAESLRMPRTWPGFSPFHFSSSDFNLLPAQVHPGNILWDAPARKWKPVFLARFPALAPPILQTQIFSSAIHKSFLLPQTLLR